MTPEQKENEERILQAVNQSKKKYGKIFEKVLLKQIEKCKKNINNKE